MCFPTIHIPGKWYYTSLFQLNNINLQLQSPLCHWSLNEDLSFVLPSLYCWYQLDRCAEDSFFFNRGRLNDFPCRPIDLHCHLELFSLMTDGYIPPRELTSVKVWLYLCDIHRDQNLFCRSEIQHCVDTYLNLHIGRVHELKLQKRRYIREQKRFSFLAFGPI